jgi:hypothetical protein
MIFAFPRATEVYRLLCSHINFWYSTIKTISTTRFENGNYKKIWEKTPKTSYQQLLESPDPSEKTKTELRRRAERYNPVELHRLLNKADEHFLRINHQKAHTALASPREAFD